MKRDPQTWLGAARRLRGALQAVHANSGALLRLIYTLEGKQASAVPKCRRNTDAAGLAFLAMGVVATLLLQDVRSRK